jgi:hypothetical protein
MTRVGGKHQAGWTGGGRLEGGTDRGAVAFKRKSYIIPHVPKFKRCQARTT